MKENDCLIIKLLLYCFIPKNCKFVYLVSENLCENFEDNVCTSIVFIYYIFLLIKNLISFKNIIHNSGRQ